jgi:hypothetical protein
VGVSCGVKAMIDDLEIPLLWTIFRLFDCVGMKSCDAKGLKTCFGELEASVTSSFSNIEGVGVKPHFNPSRRLFQMGSLAGAAHLLNGNAGVPRRAQ